MGSLDRGSLLGAVSRALIAQDARWISGAISSASDPTTGSAPMALLLLSHSSRIVYEGSIAIRSANPNLGVPPLAALLPPANDPITERARHATKLLDDNRKTMASLLHDMREYFDTHHFEFSGNAVWFARWLESDLGLTFFQGHLLYATIPLQFRLGIPPSIPPSAFGSTMNEVARQQGSALAVLAAADGHNNETRSKISFTGIAPVAYRDRKAHRYLARRYDLAFTMEAKLLMLVLEGEAASAHLLLPHTATGHEEAVFRARIVSLHHLVSSLRSVLDFHPAARAPKTSRLRSLLAEPSLDRFLNDPGARRVRNRSMHYEIRDGDTAIDPTAPMFGIVEASYPGHTFDELNREVEVALARVADALADWRG
ncbi:MAG: hypothetical protein JWQ39_1196 [Glaciihabitans sp.]|nr:hypothetical protein [Glaciihabitans sp.]